MRESTREKAAAVAASLEEDYSVVTIDGMDKAYGAAERAFTQLSDAITMVGGVDIAAYPAEGRRGVESAQSRLRQARELAKRAMIDLIPDAEGSHNWRGSDIS